MKTRMMLVLWVLLAIGIAATQREQHSEGSAALQPATPVTSGVTRTVLVAATPDIIKNDALQLVRYEIQPGTTLPAHTHPGVQIASIASGELTYSVIEGSAQIQRGAADGEPDATETLEAGERTVLLPGDSVIETADMVHFGANEGDEPVVILAATLMDAAQPAAIVQDAE